MSEEISEERIYVNLRADGMYVSRTTYASRTLRLSCGAHLVRPETLPPITIEYCHLSPAEFQSFRLAQQLNPSAFATRYGLTLDAVLRYEGISATAT